MIKIGDMVMQVRKHCDTPVDENTMFMPFIVRITAVMVREDGRCNACGKALLLSAGTKVVVKRVDGGTTQVIPFSWLRKINPPAVKSEKEVEEVA